MTHKIETLKKFFDTKIENWYYNAEIDYGRTGEFVDAELYADRLCVYHIEDDQLYITVTYWPDDYSLEQLWEIWASNIFTYAADAIEREDFNNEIAQRVKEIMCANANN